jgi:hypothetical protein
MLVLLVCIGTEPQAAPAAWNSTLVGVLNVASVHIPACRMDYPTRFPRFGLAVLCPTLLPAEPRCGGVPHP